MNSTESHDSKNWRARAQTIRAMAQLFQSESRERLLKMAVDCEQRAEQADRDAAMQVESHPTRSRL
jgi:hypothetical protein